MSRFLFGYCKVLRKKTILAVFFSETQFYASIQNGILYYPSFQQTVIRLCVSHTLLGVWFDTAYSHFSYDFEGDRWIAKNKEKPNFFAFTEAGGKSLALGKHLWNIFNDSKVVAFDHYYSITKIPLLILAMHFGNFIQDYSFLFLLHKWTVHLWWWKLCRNGTEMWWHYRLWRYVRWKGL